MPAEKVTAPHVYRAISWVTGELKKTGISKSQRNKEQGFNFRGIDQVYQSLCGLLSEAQLIVTPRVVDAKFEQRTSKSGTAMFNTFLTVEFDFVSAVDGSKHTSRTVGEATDSGDKGANKAMSAAYKYNAIQAFAIPVAGEPDADEHTNEETVAQPAREPAQKTQRRAQDPERNAELVASEPAQEADNEPVMTQLHQEEVKLLLTGSKADTKLFFDFYKVTGVAELKERDFKAIQFQLKKKMDRLTADPKTATFKGVRA